MKYRDYLIVPALIMYLLYTSCAYIANKGQSKEAGNVEIPVASVCPTKISWGNEAESSGDNWYAGGARGADYFTVTTSDAGTDAISFYDSRTAIKGVSCAYTVSDMHLKCNNDGQKYDLIFVDELTAYDCNSGTYYQRGDYASIVDKLTSGKFVNSENPRDYYIFKPDGKSAEYFGEKVFKGKWNLNTTDSIYVYDNQCREYFHFTLLTDGCGEVSGFSFNNTNYYLAA